MRRLFVDMDGVLADFDRGHELTLGRRPDKGADDVDWAAVRRVPHFYRDLPPMPDFAELWAGVLPYEPTILTGVPRSMNVQASANKREWVDRWCGERVTMIGCPSRDKSLFMSPGDVIIDDWDKHQKTWEDRGGHWILHVSAEQSLRELRELWPL